MIPACRVAHVHTMELSVQAFLLEMVLDELDRCTDVEDAVWTMTGMRPEDLFDEPDELIIPCDRRKKPR